MISDGHSEKGRKQEAMAQNPEFDAARVALLERRGGGVTAKEISARALISDELLV